MSTLAIANAQRRRAQPQAAPTTPGKNKPNPSPNTSIQNPHIRTAKMAPPTQQQQQRAFQQHASNLPQAQMQQQGGLQGSLKLPIDKIFTLISWRLGKLETNFQNLALQTGGGFESDENMEGTNVNNEFMHSLLERLSALEQMPKNVVPVAEFQQVKQNMDKNIVPLLTQLKPAVLALQKEMKMLNQSMQELRASLQEQEQQILEQSNKINELSFQLSQPNSNTFLLDGSGENELNNNEGSGDDEKSNTNESEEAQEQGDSTNQISLEVSEINNLPTSSNTTMPMPLSYQDILLNQEQLKF